MARFDWIMSDFIRHEKGLGEVNYLVRQLSQHAEPLELDAAIYIAEQDCSLWRGAFDEQGHLRGMATISPRYKPTGVALYLDDLVFDEAFLEKGSARALFHQLVEQAQQECPLPIKTIDWSCGLGENRIRANKFYEKLGAEVRPTNHYTYKIGS
jgi:GNAT superfamily N-acetyltransferase